MRFVIKHEIKGRLRVHILQSRMSFAQADTLQYYLDGQSNIVSAKIQERTLDVTVVYTGSREEALKTLEDFTYQGTEVPENYLANSGREMNREYKDQLINKVVMHYGIRLFLPMDIRSVILAVIDAVPGSNQRGIITYRQDFPEISRKIYECLKSQNEYPGTWAAKEYPVKGILDIS